MEVRKGPATGVERECAVKRDSLTPAMDVMELLAARARIMNVCGSQQVRILLLRGGYYYNSNITSLRFF